MINVHIVIQMLIHVSITASYLTNDCSFLYQFMMGEASVKHINQGLFPGAFNKGDGVWEAVKNQGKEGLTNGMGNILLSDGNCTKSKHRLLRTKKAGVFWRRLNRCFSCG